jgi:hypothetical protein
VATVKIRLVSELQSEEVVAKELLPSFGDTEAEVGIIEGNT